MKKLVFAGVLLLAAPVFADTTSAKAGVPVQPADASYVLKIEAPAAAKGARSVAHIKLTPGAGYHMNKEYPTSLALTPPAGVTLDKAKLTAKDAAKWEEAGGEFAVQYTAVQPGKQRVTGELKFAVCSANSCDPKKSTISFEIDVK
jgi:hypothetical protein